MSDLPVRVLLVDDHAVVRAGLTLLLSGFDDIACVGEAADGHEVVDYSETPAADFVDSASAVAKDLLEHKDSQGFAFDKYGVGSYMAAVKIKGMVVANISDERSAYMTREHNGSRMVTMGPGVVGTEVAKKIAREFLRAQYAGGRHQIRVDMLNKMA